MIPRSSHSKFKVLRSRGFSLLEVVIAAFIFSFVSVGFLSIWGLQVRSLEKSRHMLVATLLAEELIEESMAEGYNLLEVGGPNHFDVDMEFENKGDRLDWTTMKASYERTRLVQEIFVNPDDSIKRVTVVVKWEDTSGPREITLETVVAGTF